MAGMRMAAEPHPDRRNQINGGAHKSAAPAARDEAPPPVVEETSRIIVKNLPKHVDERRIREHFAQKGEVTDAKVVRTRDGQSRLFGFVGYSTAGEAAAAVKYFNKSFMDASRLEVQFAHRYGAGEAPRAWSKYTEGTSAHRRVVEASGANTVALGDGDGEAGKKSRKKGKTAAQAEPEDPKLREFLALMQPRSKQAIWANDDTGAAEAAALPPPTAGAAVPVDVHLEDGGGSDDELYEELPGRDESGSEEEEGGEAAGKELDPVVANAAVSDLDYLRSRVRKNFDNDDEEEGEEGGGSSSSSGSEEEEAEVGEGVESGSDAEMEEAGEKIGTERGGANAEAEEEAEGNAIDAIFGRKRGRGDGAHRRGDTAGPGPSSRSQQQSNPTALISQTGRLFVRNLPFTATEEDLRRVFEPHGEVSEAHLVLDKATRKSRGYAMVQFSSTEDAVAAHGALDGSIFMGRLLHVLPGERTPAAALAEAAAGDAGGADGAGGAPSKGTSSYKRQKEEAMKASAGNKVAWNSLFMRADTVAEAVAAHYGVSKADLLDPHAPDMAVRMALGETQVIAETKDALQGAGVDVAALEAAAAAAGRGTGAGGVARSDRVLLVKNLPYAADEAELEALFGGVGPVVRLVLPPTRTLALVEYGEAQDARKAFKALAYKRYQCVPIYLEWAPAGVFSSAAAAAAAAVAKKKKASEQDAETAAEKKKQKRKEQEEEAVRPEDVAAGLAAAAAGDDNLETSTLYVKNISFETEDAGLAAHFAQAAADAGGALRSAKVARRKAKDGRMLSSGFGFVECSSEAVARAVVSALQASTLDGHRLVLQLAQGEGKKEAAAKKGGPAAPNGKGATKIVVRNLAFEATRKDVLGLFTPFGAVKSSRLPRKFDGSHRGFAFVDFATPQEAKSAVEAVTGTHLYGRRLVIEWAEEEGGLDELRAKTAVKFRGEEGALQGGRGREREEEEKQQQQQREEGKQKKARRNN